MGSMQLLRAALVALANPKTFGGSGLHMRRREGSAPPPERKSWRKRCAVVFIDGSGWLNLAAAVSRATLMQAQAAAKRSLELLTSASPEAFDAVFLAPQHPASAWDCWVHVAPPDATGGAGALDGDLPAWR